jgi:hypothetical protein
MQAGLYMSAKILWFSFKHTRFSKNFATLFLQSCVNIPQTENIRSTRACDAAAALRSSEKSAIRLNKVCRCAQNVNGLVSSGWCRTILQLCYLLIWISGVSLLIVDVELVSAEILADTNLNLLSSLLPCHFRFKVATISCQEALTVASVSGSGCITV